MKRYLLFILLSIVATYIEPYEQPSNTYGKTWQTCIDRHNKQGGDLRQEMKEQILGDFVHAGSDPNQLGETRVFIEIIRRYMNQNRQESLSKASLKAMLAAFHNETADRYDRADQICAGMTITSSELHRAKRILNKTSFNPDIEQIYPELMNAIPECKKIPFNAPDELKKEVTKGNVTEDCIVRCMHARILVLSLAVCLINSQ